MRYYRLTIDKYIFELNEKNPSAPRLTFSIASFSDALLYAPSVITIYNVSTSMFSNSDIFVGKTLTLTAGLKQGVLTNKAGITPSTNDLIYFGTVMRCVPNFTGQDTSISFYVVSFPSKLNKPYEVSLNQGEQVIAKIESLLSNVLNNPNFTISHEPTAESITHQSKETHQLKASSVEEVLNIAKGFNLAGALEMNGIKFYTRDNSPKSAMINFKPQASDFLSQPSWETIVKMSCVFHLRGDLRIFQKIEMPSTLLTNLTPLVSSGSLAGVNYKPRLIFGGTFTITTILHIGDSRSSNAEAWSTTIEALKSGDNMGV